MCVNDSLSFQVVFDIHQQNIQDKIILSEFFFYEEWKTKQKKYEIHIANPEEIQTHINGYHHITIHDFC